MSPSHLVGEELVWDLSLKPVSVEWVEFDEGLDSSEKDSCIFEQIPQQPNGLKVGFPSRGEKTSVQKVTAYPHFPC